MAKANTTDIERRGDCFAIIHYDANGNKSELPLSEATMLNLAPAFTRLLRAQLALRQPPPMTCEGISPVIRSIVVRANLNVDLLGIEVLLGFEDVQGSWTHYGIPPDLARQIGERLIARAAEANKLSAARTKQ